MAVPLANVARWDDFLPPPTLDELNALADEFSTRPLHSRDCRESWVCPSCTSKNEPIRNLFMNLPPYACQLCEHKNPTNYAWSMVDVVFNRAELDFMVYNQRCRPFCTIYAVTGAVDCAYRVRGALSGVSNCAALDPAELIRKYSILHKHEYEKMPSSMLYEWMDKAPQVLRIVRDHGIALKKGKLERDPTLRRRIRGFFNVDKDNVLVITRLLASGFPLVATMRVGKLFGFLSHDQTYTAPIPGCQDGYHSVVLVGSGTAPRNGGVETFYVARNSHGIRLMVHTIRRNMVGISWCGLRTS